MNLVGTEEYRLIMSEEIRLQPFGNEEYKVMIMGRADDRLSVFVNVGKRLLQEYSTAATVALSDLDYQGDQGHLIQDVAVAWYAHVCGNSYVPRTVLWHDDPKLEVLTKLRDVICHQRWGKTLNQHPKVQEIFPKLNFGVVAEDPIGFARGAAIRSLIAAAYDKEAVPMVYFDQMRRYPAYFHDLFSVIKSFNIGNEIEEFDPDFSRYVLERLEAAAEVLSSPDNRPLDQSPIWQKYINDWDDYQYWLDKKRGIADSPQDL